MKKLLCFLVVLLFIPKVTAQLHPYPSDFEKVPEKTKTHHISIPSYKKPSFWHKPTKSTPSEQFKYACEMLNQNKLSEAASAFNDYVHQWHNEEDAPKAQYLYATTLVKMGKYKKAFSEFIYLLKYYNYGFSFDDVFKNMIDIAKYYMTEANDAWMVSRWLTPARAMLQKCVEIMPFSEKTAECLYHMAIIEEKLNMVTESLNNYSLICQRFPDTEYYFMALFRLAICSGNLARKNKNNISLYEYALALNELFLKETKPQEIQSRFPFISGYREEILNQQKQLKKEMYTLALNKLKFYDKPSTSEKDLLLIYSNFLEKYPECPEADYIKEKKKALEAKKYEHQ